MLKQEGKSTLALRKIKQHYLCYELTYKEETIDPEFELSEQEYEAIKL